MGRDGMNPGGMPFPFAASDTVAAGPAKWPSSRIGPGLSHLNGDRGALARTMTSRIRDGAHTGRTAFPKRRRGTTFYAHVRPDVVIIRAYAVIASGSDARAGESASMTGSRRRPPTTALSTRVARPARASGGSACSPKRSARSSGRGRRLLRFPEPSLVRLLRHDAGGIVGNGWLDAVHPEDREHCSPDWSGVRTTARPFEQEYRLRRRRRLPVVSWREPSPSVTTRGRWSGPVPDLHGHRRSQARRGPAAPRGRGSLRHGGGGGQWADLRVGRRDGPCRTDRRGSWPWPASAEEADPTGGLVATTDAP